MDIWVGDDRRHRVQAEGSDSMAQVGCPVTHWPPRVLRHTGRGVQEDKMWIFTQSGMVSIVEHREDPALVLLRARRREHLASFLGTSEGIEREPSADYEYRITLPKAQVSELASTQVRSIDYPNFKGKVDRLPDRAYSGALHEIWRVVYQALAGNKGQG